jgi:ribosomal protein L16 Arg81 hydroxylase
MVLARDYPLNVCHAVEHAWKEASVGLREPTIGLPALVAPFPMETFFEQYWERKPLTIHREDPAYFSSLFSVSDLDSVIYFTRPKFPSPEEADGYGHDAGKTFLRGDDANPSRPQVPEELSLSDLADAYREGRTIIVNGMERRWPAIAQLCHHLEGDLHQLIGANLYLTPPNSQGFPAHHDTHDVFIVQVEGSKHWRVYDSPEPIPLPGPPRTHLGTSLGQPSTDITLHAGDMLYIPRGFIHEVSTNDCYSLHLTLGVFGFRWADLLGEAVRAAAEQEFRLRKMLPPGYLHGDKLQDQFRELLQLFAGSASLPAALERIAQRFFKYKPVIPAGQFVTGENMALTLDTLLEKQAGLICAVFAEGETVKMQSQTKEFSGPRRIESALRFVAETRRFTARSLPTSLNESSRLVLVRRLLAERLLRVV